VSAEPEAVTLPDVVGQPEIIAATGPALPSRAVLRLIERAVADFALIEAGDRVAVGISGGKDSLLLLSALTELSRRADRPFELRAIHLDQHQPGFDRAGFEAALKRLGADCEIISADTWSVVSEKLRPGQIPCALCGRMRRGILNRWCAEHGYNKLALGHHLDDAVETFLLNLLFGRRLDPLKAATPASDYPVTTIRPLILVEERKVEAWVAEHRIPTIPCPVCDTFPDSKRRDLKAVVADLARVQPEMLASVRQALYGAGDADTAQG
jgi:tRNA 2-thiocytidine biosynthesis protein TtcA